MNTLTGGLAKACKQWPLEEKILLVPSLRVGRQWLDSVARAGQPVINVHTKTILGLAMDLAAPEMTRSGSEFISGTGRLALMDQILGRLRQKRGYLAALEASPTLTRSLLGAIHALRMAGLAGSGLAPSAFEVPLKGKELARILEGYSQALREGNLLDEADIYRIAIDRLRNEVAALGEALVLYPDDLDLSGLSADFLEAIPATKRHLLATDAPLVTPEEFQPRSDLDLLRWLPAPSHAPTPIGDGTARILRAMGEVNEVRQALRLCLEEGLPLDETELLYTDSSTYLPLIFETATLLTDSMGLYPEGLPVTFAEGVPARYTRPGRALLAWVEWVAGDGSQKTLVRMIQDGLLEIPGRDSQRWSLTRLAGLLRSVPVGKGLGRYLPKLDEAIQAAEDQAANDLRKDDGEEADPIRIKRAQERIEGLTLIRDFVGQLLAQLPAPASTPDGILDAAARFMESFARSLNELDSLARQRLAAEIREMARWLARCGEATSLDPLAWLAALPAETHVGGSGPMSGHLHAAPLLAGGHSGRPFTIIIGMDDTRFPGAGLQDPLLLDSEREVLSPELSTAARDLERRTSRLASLLARLRGRLILSCSCRDIIDDRDLFPCSALLEAYRILSGDHEADQQAMLEALPSPAACAPDHAESALSETEWWLWRLCTAAEAKDPLEAVYSRYPHLREGAEALVRRGEEAFGEYDGHVPEAGPVQDPTDVQGQVFSASCMEKLGRCPLSYFFRYVLGIEPPEDLEADSTRWLDPAQFGSLLHDVFYDFVGELMDGNQWPPAFGRDQARMEKILESHIASYRELCPPPGESVFRREQRLLAQAALIFLHEEENYARENGNWPLYREAAFGMESTGDGTPLDDPNPVPITLPDGRTLRVRGRIDRIDEIHGENGSRFILWDYKSGSTWNYNPANPFLGGRRLQHAIYMEAARERIKKQHGCGAEIQTFGYFFPSVRARGERVFFEPAQLAEGGQVLVDLCELATSGSFIASDSVDDCTYCDYRSICRDSVFTAACTGVKMANAGNKGLEPFRKLRGKG